MNAAPLVHLPILSNSSRNTFQRCPREYQYRYVMNRKTRRMFAALKFGSLFHRGLNAWWLCNGDASTKLAEGVTAMKVIGFRDEAPDEFELAKAVALLAGYTARWGEEKLRTLCIEKNFRLPLTDSRVGAGTGFDLGGSIDAIVSDEKGHIHNVEHKTTSSDIGVGEHYWHHIMTMDPQVSTYSAAAREMGFPVRDTIYDVVRKPAFEPLKATPEESRKYTKPTKAEPIPRLYANQRETDETPEEYGARIIDDIAKDPQKYFQRMTVVRLENDDEAHASDIREVANMLAWCDANQSYPRAPSQCIRYGRACEYHPVCSGLTTIDDEREYQTKTKTHEELSE